MNTNLFSRRIHADLQIQKSAFKVKKYIAAAKSFGYSGVSFVFHRKLHIVHQKRL